MRRTPPKLIVFGLVTALIVAACGGSGESQPESTQGSVTRNPVTSTAPDDSEGPGGTEAPVTDVKLTKLAQVSPLSAMAADPVTNDLWVSELGGYVRRVNPESGDVSDVLLDLSNQTSFEGERGLLGITISPDGSRLYLYFTNLDGNSVVDEYRISGGSVDAGSPRRVFTQDQPFSNHNGGDIHFGPDGFLYIGLGDGGSGGDPEGNGQNPNALLGSILRIDPLSGDPYSVPAGNPFVAGGGAPEVWAYGLRNPWRFNWDIETGDLWIADVGQNSLEEINWVPGSDAGRGANFQWANMEGTAEFKGSVPPGSTGPIYEYSHDGGNCSITGGYVYRGDAIPFLDGVYLFADLCVGGILGIRAEAGAVTEELDLGLNLGEFAVASFGQDAGGEMYVLALDGSVYRLDPA